MSEETPTIAAPGGSALNTAAYRLAQRYAAYSPAELALAALVTGAAPDLLARRAEDSRRFIAEFPIEVQDA